MTFEKLYQNKYCQLIVIAFIACVFIHEPQAILQNDLDSAVRWASNHLFQFGSKNLLLYPHTNGPLFFLKFPIPKGVFIRYAVFFDVLSKVLLGYYLLKLSFHYRPKQTWLPIIIFVGLCALLNFDFIIISITVAICMLALNTRKVIFLIPGIFVLVISIYIKASISFPALFIFGSTILLLIVNKEFKQCLQIIAAFLLLFILSTLILYGFNLDGFIWIFNSFVKTLGYGSDQAIYFNNYLPYVLLAAAFIILPLFLVNKNAYNKLFFITILAVFAVWKYSFGRQDFAHYQAWSTLIIMLTAFAIIINDKRGGMISAACYLLSFTFFISNTKRNDSPKEYIYTTPNIDLFPRVIFRYPKVVKQYQNRTNYYLNKITISDSILNSIGDKTVDVFPWESAILYKYDLNYKPRPNFHSTILGADADASDHFNFISKDAPEFLLWHKSQQDIYSLNGHNQTYLPNEIAGAISGIKNNYTFLMQDGDYALWRKQKSNIINFHKGSYGIDIKMNSWFKAPNYDSARSIYGNIDLSFSFLDRIKSFLYKGHFFKIEYKLTNGKTSIHFVSTSSLQKNFLLQPYFINPKMEYLVIDSIKIVPLNNKFKGKNIHLEYWD